MQRYTFFRIPTKKLCQNSLDGPFHILSVKVQFPSIQCINISTIHIRRLKEMSLLWYFLCLLILPEGLPSRHFSFFANACISTLTFNPIAADTAHCAALGLGLRPQRFSRLQVCPSDARSKNARSTLVQYSFNIERALNGYSPRVLFAYEIAYFTLFHNAV